MSIQAGQNWQSKLVALQLGLICGLTTSVALGVLTSTYFVSGIQNPKLWTLCGPMRRFFMFLKLYVEHSGDSHIAWLGNTSSLVFFFALLSMFCAITTYLARPVIARRFFITGLLTSAYSWLYFTLVCDTHFCTHPNPIPWGVPVFWNTLYPLAHEDWYRQELASLVVKHTEIILIPSVIILLTFAADRAGHNNKALENSPALDLKLKLAIILSTLLLSAAAIWITMGMGTRAEDNYVVLANCSIPAGKILAKSDLFVFDPIFKTKSDFRAIDQLIGRQLLNDKECGSYFSVNELSTNETSK